MRVKPLILTVDDDLVFRKSLEAVLVRLGLIVRGSETAAEFFQDVKSFHPDLCMVDLQLGDGSGLDIIRDLRALSPEAIIIVISGVENGASIAHSLELGANDFILKPLDRILLASKLSRYLKTEEILTNMSIPGDPGEGRVPAALFLDFDIAEIDELGLKLVGTHMISKGTVLKLRTELFAQFIQLKEDLLVAITHTAFDEKAGKYSATAEFVDVPVDFTEALRGWLAVNATVK